MPAGPPCAGFRRTSCWHSWRRLASWRRSWRRSAAGRIESTASTPDGCHLVAATAQWPTFCGIVRQGRATSRGTWPHSSCPAMRGTAGAWARAQAADEVGPAGAMAVEEIAVAVTTAVVAARLVAQAMEARVAATKAEGAQLWILQRVSPRHCARDGRRPPPAQWWLRAPPRWCDHHLRCRPQ